ncbi:type III secretion protein [Pseudomonas sp. LB1P83]
MSLSLRWKDLLEQPLTFVERHYLYECFPDAVAIERIHALTTEPRFQSRLLKMLMTHFKLHPLAQTPTPAEEDLPVLLMAPDVFRRLPRLCGAIWHAATLSREIRSEFVSQLRERLGDEVFALALANRQWAGATDSLRQPDELVAAIDQDGARCVAAWLQTQPSPLREWLRLRLLDPAVADGRPSPMNVQIVRHIAAVLVRTDTGETP